MKFRVAAIAAAALAAIAPVPATVVERYYSNAVFPALQRVVTLFSNVWSIALLDVLLVLVVVWLVFQAIGIFVLRRRFGWIAATLRTIANIATAAAIFYLLFLAMWGLNYRRVPISQKMPFDPGRVTPPAVLALAHTTVDQVNGLYASAHTADSVRSPINPSLASAFADAQHTL